MRFGRRLRGRKQTAGWDRQTRNPGLSGLPLGPRMAYDAATQKSPEKTP